jgi:hypothetical protein
LVPVACDVTVGAGIVVVLLLLTGLLGVAGAAGAVGVMATGVCALVVALVTAIGAGVCTCGATATG